MAGYEKKVLAAGCSAYVTKPVDIDALLAAVAGFLGGEKLAGGAHEAARDAGASARQAGAAAADAPAPPGEPIVSRLAHKPRFIPVIHRFVEHLQRQLDTVEAARLGRDHEAIARFGHWLAGAAGTVGYDAFTDAARQIEQQARQGDIAAVELALANVRAMAARVALPVPHDLAVPA